jgi:Skp family chaperone for outer membrane proteins
MNRIVAAIAFAALLLPLASVQAQNGNYRTAYVNMQTVFESYYKTVQANISFANQKREFLDRLRLMEEQMKPLQAEGQRLQAELKDDDGLMTEEAKKETARKLRLLMERAAANQQEYMAFRQNGRREVEEKRLQAEGELIEDLSAFVRKYCEMNGYHIVYDINGKSLNRMPVLLLYPKELEITDELVTAVNRGHEEELAKAREELKAIEAKLAEDVDGK